MLNILVLISLQLLTYIGFFRCTDAHVSVNAGSNEGCESGP